MAVVVAVVVVEDILIRISKNMDISFRFLFYLIMTGDVINVVVEDISVVIVVMNNESKKDLAMDIGEFFH